MLIGAVITRQQSMAPDVEVNGNASHGNSSRDVGGCRVAHAAPSAAPHAEPPHATSCSMPRAVLRTVHVLAHQCC